MLTVMCAYTYNGWRITHRFWRVHILNEGSHIWMLMYTDNGKHVHKCWITVYTLDERLHVSIIDMGIYIINKNVYMDNTYMSLINDCVHEYTCTHNKYEKKTYTTDNIKDYIYICPDSQLLYVASKDSHKNPDHVKQTDQILSIDNSNVYNVGLTNSTNFSCKVPPC